MGKFLTVFIGMLLYLGLWGIPIISGALALRAGIEWLGATLLIGGIVGCLLFMLPFMHGMTGRVFRYAGEGAPIDEATLRDKLQAINDVDAPVMVVERGDKLIVTWNYVDAAWWNVLSRSGMDKVYELHIKLDDKRKTATLIDVHKSVNWRVGPDSVRLWGGYSRGVDLSYERVIGYGWNDAFQFERVVDYTFKTSDIKNPVINLLIENGWWVKFGMW